MTHNNISYIEALERKRSNLMQEAETHRSNVAKERISMLQLEETKRSNLVNELNAQTKAQLEYEAKRYATEMEYEARKYATDVDYTARELVAGIQAASNERAASIHAGASVSAAQISAGAQTQIAQLNAETQRMISADTLSVRRDELAVAQEHNWATEYLQSQGIEVDYASIAQRQQAAEWTHQDTESRLTEEGRHNVKMEEIQDEGIRIGAITNFYGSSLRGLPGIIGALGGN